NNFELLDPLAAVFSYVDIAFGVHRDAMSLVELPGEVSGAAETRQDLAGLTVQDFDFRIVLVDQVHERLIGVAREGERYRRASTLFRFPVGWRGDRLPWGVASLDEVSHLVVPLYPRSLSVADIDEAISVPDQAVHGFHPLGLPLA